MASSDQPPRFPSSLDQIDRANALLGIIGNGVKLREGKRLELVEILGGVPKTSDQARTWKRELKAHRQTLKDQ